MLVLTTKAHVADLEVVHCRTSSGEGAAVAKFAEAIDATGKHKRIEVASAGGGETNAIPAVALASWVAIL